MIATFLLVLSPIVFLWLWFSPAPYGRHSDGKWGPEIPGRLAWVVMEWPTLVLFVWLAGPHPLVLLWLLHYVRRTLIYPFLQTTVRPMPLLVALSGMAFQLLNCTANGQALSLGASTGPLLWLGVAVFLLGQAVNLHGDEVLRTLRPPGDTNYYLPEKGLYRWVTNVSYLGEILTWLGWTLAAGSLAGLAFLVFTIANLAPRARSNAAWYVDRFGRMPGRWVLLPGLW